MLRAQRNESIFCLGNLGTTSRRYHLQNGSLHVQIIAVCSNDSFRFHLSQAVYLSNTSSPNRWLFSTKLPFKGTCLEI